MSLFSVKNFEKFQHYKDRNPPWIRLYNSLLDDYEFGKLPDASKAHLIAIWLLASRYDNKIPYDAEWVSRRINATEPVNLEILEHAGFIVKDQDCSNMLADCKQSAMPEERRVEERRVETEKKEQDALTREFDWEFWPTYPHHVQRKSAFAAFRKARKREDLETILDGVRRYIRTKPPDRHWLNPATFLNQERWTDEPSQHPTTAKPSQHDRIFGALAEIGEGLDDPGGRHMDHPPGIDDIATDGGPEFGGVAQITPRLRAV